MEAGEGTSTTFGGKYDEKNIYKSALLKTVAVLNEGKDEEKKRSNAKPRVTTHSKAGDNKKESENKKAYKFSKSGEMKKDISAAEGNGGVRKRNVSMVKRGTESLKQNRNAIKKLGGKREENSSFLGKNHGANMIGKEKRKDDGEMFRKKTRKERREEKIKSRGNGLSSREYVEKFIKKTRSKREKEGENMKTRSTIPSKHKQNFSKNKENIRKRTKR